MSGQESHTPQPPVEPNQSRPAAGTENSWCQAVPGGTGITVLALLFSKAPDIPLLRHALNKLQLTHPILKSKVGYNPTNGTYSYVIPSTPQLQIEQFDVESTSEILQGLVNSADNTNNSSVSNFHLILEHELNRNTWRNPEPSSDLDVFFASVYTLSADKWVVGLRVHTSVCDRTTAVSLLRELLRLTCEENEGGTDEEIERAWDIRLGIEDYVPREKGNKPFWARGLDVLGYSLNSFRLSNLDFKDAASPRSSQVIRLQLNAQHTQQILSVSNSLNLHHLIF